jgi:hypothetical protein
MGINGATKESPYGQNCLRGVSTDGFSIDMMVELVNAGLATATGERVVAGGKTIEVARVRITEAGRQLLTEL